MWFGSLDDLDKGIAPPITCSETCLAKSPWKNAPRADGGDNAVIARA